LTLSAPRIAARYGHAPAVIARIVAHSDWLLLAAIDVQADPYIGSAAAMRVQHPLSCAHEPADAPPSPVVPPLLPLLPSLPQAEEQLCPSHVNTGPSQVEQLPVSHAASCCEHMASRQLTHAAG